MGISFHLPQLQCGTAAYLLLLHMGMTAMKSLVIKRSILLAGRKTSVSVEDEFWNALKEIAKAREMTLSQLVLTIDTQRQHDNLSSAIRLFVLTFYRDRIADRTSDRAQLVAQGAGTYCITSLLLESSSIESQLRL
jgi:predicted DNA-binding ribbon-helix-helix protein